MVDLRDFSLSSSQWRSLRQSHAKALRSGLSFEVIPSEAVKGWLPQLKAISDAWLENKQGREKGFSVGSFDADYLCGGPIALVRHEQRLVGFANLWTSNSRQELSVDLMCYDPELTSGGVMDFLFTELYGMGASPRAAVSIWGWLPCLVLPTILWPPSGTSWVRCCICEETASITSRGCDGTRRSLIQSGNPAIFCAQAVWLCRGY